MKVKRRKLEKIVAGAITAMLLGLPADAMAVEVWTNPDGKITLNYYEKGDVIDSYGYEKKIQVDSSLADWQKKQLQSASDYWYRVLRMEDNDFGMEFNVYLTSEGVYSNNAYACSVMEKYERNGEGYYESSILRAARHEGVSLGKGEIGIGAAVFSADRETDWKTPLNRSFTMPMESTFIHEMMHAIGLQTSTNKENTGFIPEKQEMQEHLYDWRGVQAEPGMLISTVDHPVSSGKYFDTPGYQDNPDGKLRFACFAGEHVSEVLEGAWLPVVDLMGVKLDQSVQGLPIYTTESMSYFVEKGVLDLSHTELRGSLMGHQFWRNYSAPMEIELALLQDLGCSIDRRDFFGRSIYGSGLTLTNTSPFYARNRAGTEYIAGAYNTSPYGIGLHIYGDNNTVTQAADILTKGDAGVGIRVDGAGNSVQVAAGTEIHADGLNGNGLLVSYGKDHRVALERGSSVTALGEGGIGAQFNFGRNMVGAVYGERASYAGWFDATVKTLACEKAETDGPLVGKFTVNGLLAGSKQAIYIGDNAFVKNIEIGTGAKVIGAIQNDWMYDDAEIYAFFKSHTNYSIIDMHRQYSGAEDLITGLTFSGDGLSYSGNITGTKNTRLGVTVSLLYSGSAAVLSAEVGRGGTLAANGTFALTEGGEDHTLGYTMNGASRTLQKVGIFTNHGTVIPLDGDMKISSGDFVSDGNIGITTSADGATANKILVENGTADITGSGLGSVEGQVYRIGTGYRVLQAQTVNGSLKEENGAFSGLLDAVRDIGAADALDIHFELANHMGALDENQQAVFEGLGTIAEDKAFAVQTGKLFSLNGEHAKTALSDISGSGNTEAAAALLQSTGVMRALSARQSWLGRNTSPSSMVSVNHRMSYDGSEDIIPVDFGARGGLWLRTMKDWSKYGRSGISGHGFNAAVGVDFAVSPVWRVGGLFTYGKESFGSGSGSVEAHDYRGGIYGSYHNKAHEGFLYLGAGHQTQDNTRLFYAGDMYRAESKAGARLYEFNGRYSYDLDEDRENVWHNKPYGAATVVLSKRGGYDEHGAAPWNQHVSGGTTTYSAVELGWELERDFGKDGFASFNVGVKQVLSGDDPVYTANLVRAPENTFQSKGGGTDRTRFTMGIHGSMDIGADWQLGGKVSLERGAHDTDAAAGITLRYSW